MTVWPGAIVPVPVLLVPQVRLAKGQVLVFGSTAEPEEDRPDWDIAEVPPEFYLREFLELDTDDAEAVLAFCAAWGPVGKYDCTDLANLPYSGRFAQDADRALPLPWTPGWEHFDAPGLQRRVRRLGFRHLDGVHSVGRVGIYQDALFNMVLLWRFATGAIDAAELAEEARPAGQPYIGLDRDRLRSADVSRASFELVNQLNMALTPFHVRVELHLNEFVPAGEPVPNVYQAACLQLANHIAEHVSYRRCASETCRRLFVRQRGGSKIASERGIEHGQYHSSGVMYCTPQCARAQAARVSRRRKQAAKTGKGKR